MFTLRGCFFVVLLLSLSIAVLAQKEQQVLNLISHSANPSIELSASWSSSKTSVYESVLDYKFCGKGSALKVVESVRFIHTVESGVKYDQIHKLDRMEQQNGCIEGAMVIHEPFRKNFRRGKEKITLLLLDKTQDHNTEDKMVRYQLSS